MLAKSFFFLNQYNLCLQYAFASIEMLLKQTTALKDIRKQTKVSSVDLALVAFFPLIWLTLVLRGALLLFVPSFR